MLFRSANATGGVLKNGTPLLMYLDIFKNYYANTQEKKFYMIGTSPKLTITINGINITDPDNITNTEGGITNGKTITITPETVKENEILLRVKTSTNAREQTMKPSQLGNFSIQVDEAEIAVSKIPSGQTWYRKKAST